jgi:DNA-binding CsgD family transcriptional regulator
MDVKMEDVLDSISACETITDLEREWTSTIGQLGYACFAYIDTRHLPISDEPWPYHIITLPDDYVDAYVRENFLGYDPIVRRAATSNAPFFWSECCEFAEATKPQRGTKSRARRVISVALDHGFTDGYAIPCHAVDLEGRPASSILNLYWRHDPATMVSGGSVPVWLRLAGMSFHERVLALRGATSVKRAPPSLTDREREVLVWACRGKTLDVTAASLNISERTVEFHFNNAMKKLGVVNKFHAIATAIHMGLISF